MSQLTWGEFKRLVEEKGCKNEDLIWYIDVSFPEQGKIHVDHDDCGVFISG